MYQLSSFYKFFTLPKPQLKSHRDQLYLQAKTLDLRGLILLAEEGVNASVCGQPEKIALYKEFLSQGFKENFFWKDFTCKAMGFKRLSVKIKKEIISSGGEFLSAESAFSLSPFEWEERLKKGRSQVLDVRNHYETAIGQFKTAQTLDINSFQELGHKLDHLPNMDKSQETLIYCTGGIRCEKAIPLMRAKGFKKVSQLKGGILNYLKDFPHSQFEKECFVFDHRAAVDQNLKPSSRYRLCPHCGQAGDLKISCGHCASPTQICSSCEQKAFYYHTCSKNCAYHFKAGHKYKGGNSGQQRKKTTYIKSGSAGTA